MSFDLRLPIGMMFGLYGILLTAYGLFGESKYNQKSLGINIDLAWGIVLLVFGGLMLIMSLTGKKQEDSNDQKK
jgi:formate hydrogenlyase subunit 3/multisubunit Na+/H+ antiporter MnhD subunit